MKDWCYAELCDTATSDAQDFCRWILSQAKTGSPHLKDFAGYTQLRKDLNTLPEPEPSAKSSVPMTRMLKD